MTTSLMSLQQRLPGGLLKELNNLVTFLLGYQCPGLHMHADRLPLICRKRCRTGRIVTALAVFCPELGARLVGNLLTDCATNYGKAGDNH